MRKRILAGLLFSVLTLPAWGSQISPCYRVLTYQQGVFSEEPIRFQGRLCKIVLRKQERSAVHEHMTVAAIREYRFARHHYPEQDKWIFQYMVEEKEGWVKFDRTHLTHAIIYGSWWNDDPLMLTLGQSWDFMQGGHSIWDALQRVDHEYPAKIRNCDKQPAKQLWQESHFGALQHLHFMSNGPMDHSKPVERLNGTTEDALAWIAFAYRVATGDLAPTAPFDEHMQADLKLPSIADNHCVKNPDNVKIRTLFSRLGYADEYREKLTPDVALGSILHIMQDSFSPAHTCRVPRQVDGKQYAVLTDVFNYKGQNHLIHIGLDGYPAWMQEYAKNNVHIYENDPVAIGAWMIAAVDQKLDWQTVKAHLQATIFAQAPAENQQTAQACIGRPSGDGLNGPG